MPVSFCSPTRPSRSAEAGRLLRNRRSVPFARYTDLLPSQPRFREGQDAHEQVCSEFNLLSPRLASILSAKN